MVAGKVIIAVAEFMKNPERYCEFTNIKLHMCIGKGFHTIDE